MKDLIIQIPKDNRPIYMRIADGVRTAIREGRLRSGEAMPSSRELAKKFRVHRHTVMNAIGELVAEGWIETHERVKYRVTSTLPSTFLRPKESKYQGREMLRLPIKIQRPVEIEQRTEVKKLKFQFPSGQPDVRLFPAQELKSFLYDAISTPKNLAYGDPRGNERLLNQIALYLRRVRGVADRDILVTNGSQEAIFFLAQLLINPGDIVAVEALSYPPVLAAFRFAGATLQDIPVDSEGLVVDALEKVLKTKRLRMIYITPLHQYPTTVTLSARRRLQLYEVAYKHEILILEDDYDHEFHFDSQPVAPMAGFDPGNLILYVSTFSKILFPSARIGFMAVPKSIGVEVSKLKRISSRENENHLQDAVGRWMESGGFERHLRRMRRTYEQRRDGMVETLKLLQKSHPALSWSVPEGGMALWLDTGVDSEELARDALGRGVLVAPESWYAVKPKTGTHLRLGYSSQTEEETRIGLRALASCIKVR